MLPFYEQCACIIHRLYLAVNPTSNSIPLPVVQWTQKSDIWSKLSGISGNVSKWLLLPASKLSFVPARPSRIVRGAVDYDRVSGVVYWSQSTADTSNSWSIGAQPVVDAFGWKSTSVMQFLSSWHVGGLAVDWFTGNVYVTETEDQLIAVARYDIRDTDKYRVIISSDLHQPTTIAIDPYLGLAIYLPLISNHQYGVISSRNYVRTDERTLHFCFQMRSCAFSLLQIFLPMRYIIDVLLSYLLLTYLLTYLI